MKKFLSFIVLCLSFLLLAGCDINIITDESDETTENTTVITDSTTIKNKTTSDSDLEVYIWSEGVSSDLNYFTVDEIDEIKTNFIKIVGENYKLSFNIITGVNKKEFGAKVNSYADADVILAGANIDYEDACNISILTDSAYEKAMIDASWDAYGDRFIAFASTINPDHLELAVMLRDMLLSEKPVEREYKSHYNVLFLGNSYTYFNQMYRMFNEACESVGLNVTANEIVRGSSNLSDFVNPDDSLYTQLVKYLSTTECDYIFVQEQSSYPCISPVVVETHVDNLVNLIRTYNTEAEIVLYETWARAEGNSFYTEHPTYTYKSMEKAIAETYTNIGKKYGFKVSYAGVGMYLAHTTQEGSTIVSLYQNDLTHPRAAASYMIALIHMATIFDIDPIDVTYVPTFSYTYGSYNCTQPTEEEALIMRKYASQVYNNLDLSVLD